MVSIEQKQMMAPKNGINGKDYVSNSDLTKGCSLFLRNTTDYDIANDIDCWCDDDGNKYTRNKHRNKNRDEG